MGRAHQDSVAENVTSASAVRQETGGVHVCQTAQLPDPQLAALLGLLYAKLLCAGPKLTCWCLPGSLWRMADAWEHLLLHLLPPLLL